MYIYIYITKILNFVIVYNHYKNLKKLYNYLKNI